MPEEKKFTLWARRPHVINTDPQRRCYYGENFSEETVWGPWCDLYDLRTEAEAAESVADWKKLNPTHEYVYLPIGEQPK